MSTPEPLLDTPTQDDPKGAAAEESPLRKGAALLHTFRSFMDDFLALAALEARLAGLSIAAMLGLGLAVGLLFVTAWLLLVAGGTLWLVDLGVGWGPALLVTALANVLMGIVLVVLIVNLSRNVLFKATRRQLAAGVRTNVEKNNAGFEKVDL